MHVHSHRNTGPPPQSPSASGICKGTNGVRNNPVNGLCCAFGFCASPWLCGGGQAGECQTFPSEKQAGISGASLCVVVMFVDQTEQFRGRAELFNYFFFCPPLDSGDFSRTRFWQGLCAGHGQTCSGLLRPLQVGTLAMPGALWTCVFFSRLLNLRVWTGRRGSP